MTMAQTTTATRGALFTFFLNKIVFYNQTTRPLNDLFNWKGFSPNNLLHYV